VFSLIFGDSSLCLRFEEKHADGHWFSERVYNVMFHSVLRPNLRLTNVHTNPSAATIGCMKGTGFQSTGADRLERRLRWPHL